MEDYKVHLDNYNGPLDLLLYLIRREELDIHDIPIARITEQYVVYVDLLQHLDPDAAGEFLVMAATLMEIKSRALLPRPPAEVSDEDFEDPRLELVRQLLEYKRFKDAAHDLAERADVQSQRYRRAPAELPGADSVKEVDLEELEIWDLLDAFNRLMSQIGLTRRTHDVVVDDTPIALYAADLIDWLQREGGSILFLAIFRDRTKGEIIGLFLALLELVRQRRIRACQDRVFDEIVIYLISPGDGDEQESAGEDLTGTVAEAPPEQLGEDEVSADAGSGEDSDSDLSLEIEEDEDDAIG